MKRRKTGDERLSDEEVLARKVGDEIACFDLTGNNGAGGRWMARRLPNNRFGLEEVVQAPPATMVANAEALMGRLGRVLDSQDQDGTVVIRGTFGMGFLGTTPVLVTVRVRAEGDVSHVGIEGLAKETVIKQRAGEKAARQVAAELLSPQ